MTDQGYHNARHLQTLADRCERGARQLLSEADNAAAVLATRANGDRIAPEDWAAQKRSAAAAAQQYARQLRDEAAAGPVGRVSADRIAQAEKVARASELGGILIDPATLTAASLAHPWTTAGAKQAIQAANDAERAAVDGAGVFEHIAEPGQVPFWRLASQPTNLDAPGTEPTPPAPTAQPDTDDDTDGM